MEPTFIDYKALFEEIPNIFLLSSPDFTIVAANNAFLCATNTQRDAIEGRKIFDVFTDGHGNLNESGLNNLHNSLKKVIDSGVADTMPAQKYSLSQGLLNNCILEFYWKSFNAPIYMGSSKIQFVLINIKDITKQVNSGAYGKDLQLEAAHQLNKINQIENEIAARSQELDEANRQLRRVNDELQKITYITSHDLKSHLRGINTLTQWISTDLANQLNEDGKKQLSLLNDKISSMFKLIEGILVYSSIKIHDRKKLEPIDLNCTLEDVLESLELPLNIKIEVPRKLPTLALEKNKIFQVFYQLLLNAIKFNNKSEGFIKIMALEHKREWIISIEDNGQGIDEKFHHKIFQLFQTLETKKDKTNTGAGLAIAKKIVEGWGGRMWLDSKVDIGCKFFFTIPI
jgi:signal transduction histidine kinase